ncbi:MAG: tRNA (guanine(10)-N(2))-dimethyltransferase [Candidatus Thermoplasmatota archaeon]|nr:tRNA (guanine(10)-N(2))-dimethyltransferase [Candidatus Thermoplasmatota archaeon]
MNETIEYDQIVEGTTRVYIPKQQTKMKGPGKKQGLPFYNPAMELNRDISIAVVQWLLSIADDKQMAILDGLAATGIRGIRFLHELTGSYDVVINDWSDEAFSVIRKNVEETNSEHVSYFQKDLNQVLLEQKFDYIDVDPFGSPATFIDSAMKSIRHNGVIAVSATDTAALCGVYPKVCKRRYAATPNHGSVMHEVGLRILLGFVAREAAKHEKGIQPILSYKTDHYMRLYVRVMRNVPCANETAKKIQSLSASTMYPFDEKDNRLIGPLWIGSLHSRNIVEQLIRFVEQKQFGSKKKMMKFFSIFTEEADAPLFYYTTDDLGSLLHCSPPKIDRLWEIFQEQEVPIFKTQFNPTGFKTPASFERVKKLFAASAQSNK